MSTPSLIEDIFLAALEKGSPEERSAYLAAACNDDSDLRRRVERLLEAHPKAGNFLESPILPSEMKTASFVPPPERAGVVIGGRYKLIQLIGDGGMGSVWMAQQTDPVTRLVAVKLIKEGMDSSAVIARFEAERQALAVMDHPNIAKVLDGGTTEAGRPFFVMELVKGTPITRHCDEHRLPLRERLELFIPVCQAVQHAHQKGIVHRDIKPSNVLVAPYDGRPVPKVIDFGVAKATGQRLTERTLVTEFGAVVGTLQYMSPEQAELNNLDIDTRSDVYSLGVLLYELLTGTTPLDMNRLRGVALAAVLMAIHEEESPKPSTRLNQSTDSLPSIAAQRQTEPAKLTKLVRGELDWIVMKCLEKDRSRRYETANGLARDVERYLADEMVEARPTSASYRLRKFMRKHRVALATAAAFVAILIIAAGLSSWLAVKANRAEKLADDKRTEAETNAKEAKDNAELYHQEAMENLAARIEAVITASSLQVDLDLSEIRTDPKLGLLRLAHPLKQNLESRGRKIEAFDPATGRPISGVTIEFQGSQGEFKALREFVVAAVLDAGQDYAPLLPPITHDGQAVAFVALSRDNETLLTLGKDYTARLWDTRTARQIAILHKEGERVVNCGFSPDGRTVFTDDQTSVARFWDVPSGRFRAATEARPNRYQAAAPWPFEEPGDPAYYGEVPWNDSQMGAGRLLTRRRVAKEAGSTGNIDGAMHLSRFLDWDSPVELWDTATGRFVARLDAPGRHLERFAFINQGRWVTTLEKDKSTLLVFSAEDGRLLARLKHPTGGVVEQIDVSPSGRWAATVSGKNLLVWDTRTWQAEPVTTALKSENAVRLRFLFDDLAEAPGKVIAVEYSGLGANDLAVFRYGQPDPVAEFNFFPWGSPDVLTTAGNLANIGAGHVYDIRTWQRLSPPPARKFHPGLARFAADGRFVNAATMQEPIVIDTKTDKSIPVQGEWGVLPKFGMISASASDPVQTIRIIPSADRLNIPPQMLELWAQVVMRGHLDDQSAFVKWNESTWEKKRQELAAMPAPYADFPFPGYVAQDRLHWQREEYRIAGDADKPHLAKLLLDRAEAAGDKSEAVRWRTVLEPKKKPPAKP